MHLIPGIEEKLQDIWESGSREPQTFAIPFLQIVDLLKPFETTDGTSTTRNTSKARIRISLDLQLDGKRAELLGTIVTHFLRIRRVPLLLDNEKEGIGGAVPRTAQAHRCGRASRTGPCGVRGKNPLQWPPAAGAKLYFLSLTCGCRAGRPLPSSSEKPHHRIVCREDITTRQHLFLVGVTKKHRKNFAAASKSDNYLEPTTTDDGRDYSGKIASLL